MLSQTGHSLGKNKVAQNEKGKNYIPFFLSFFRQKGQRGKIDDAILLAASLGHLDIVKMCQAKGADTEIRDPETGATPLINAAKVCCRYLFIESDISKVLNCHF